MYKAPLPTDTDMNVLPGILRESNHFYFAETDLGGAVVSSNDHFRKHFTSPYCLADSSTGLSAFLDPAEISRCIGALRQCRYMPVSITLRMKDNKGRERPVCWEFHMAKENNGIIQAIGYDEPGHQLVKELTEQAIQRQKQVTQATIDAQEKERLLIGKELHDNFSQHLITTRLYLEVAKEKITGEIKEMVTHSHNTLVKIIHELKSLSHALVPPSLGDIGLAESLHDLADTTRQMQGLSVAICCHHFNEQHLPANLKLMLFRVIQEYLQDAARHFAATVAEIRLHSDAEAITVSITDNRINPETLAGGIGPVFENITNRLSLFNGHAEETIIPGAGRILTVHVPAPPAGSVEN